MAREWPTDPDDPVDPALAPLIEAGEGESEGFEQAESELISHARHDDSHGTARITHDAAGFDDPEDDEDDERDRYGESDSEEIEDA